MRIQSEINQLQSEKIKLEKSTKDKQQQIADADYNLNFKQKQLILDQNKEFQNYHQQILFQTLLDLKDGIMIRYNYSNSFTQQNQDSIIKEKNKIIGLVGNFNSGKTWILGKLTKNEFKQGLNHRTEGLNIYYQQKQKLCFVDTAGSGETLQTQKNITKYCQENDAQQQQKEHLNQKEEQGTELKNERELYQRQQNQELLLNVIFSEKCVQSFIIDYSQIVIIMVGIMTFQDEKMINSVINQIFSRGEKEQSRLVFIVHNFYQLSTNQAVEDKIQKDIYNNFLTEKKQDFLFFQYLQDRPNEPVQHLIVAQEGTVAGNRYNEKSFNHILGEINAYRSKLAIINFNQCWYDFLNKNLNKYISKSGEEERENEDFVIQEEQIDEADKKQKEGQVKTIILASQKLKQMGKVEFKKIIFDHFGQPSQLMKQQYQPAYQVNEDNEKFVITVILPGIYKDAENKEQLEGEIQENQDTQKFELFISAKIDFQQAISECLENNNKNQSNNFQLTFSNLTTKRFTTDFAIPLCSLSTSSIFELDLNSIQYDEYILLVILGKTYKQKKQTKINLNQKK